MSYLTYQAGMARIEDLHRKAAAQRLANTARVAPAATYSGAPTPRRSQLRLRLCRSGRRLRIPRTRRAIVLAPRGSVTWRNP